MTASSALGTEADLIWIEAFPFVDERTTAGAPSERFDSYSAAPDVDESGPERIYAFQVAAAASFEATVVDAVGVDIDLHLLTALDSQACLVRDDTTVGFDIVEPGTYYLVADTYVGDSGTEYPGAYLLQVDFDGELGQPPVPAPVPEDRVDEGEEEGCSCGVPGRRHHRAPLALWLWAAVGGLMARRRRGD